MTSNAFQKVQKADPFDSHLLGDWQADKKHTNKNTLAFVRTCEITIPENHQQDWIDPVTFAKKKIWGKVVLTERKFINKGNSEMSIQRIMEPAFEGGVIKDVI